MATKKLAVAVESDGLSIGGFERRSAKMKKLSDAEWRKEVLDSLNSSGNPQLKNAAQYLQDHNWTDMSQNPTDDDQAMKGLLDHTRYSPGQSPYAGGKPLPGMPTHRDFWQYLHGNKKNPRKLAYEGDWQYRTSVSYVTKDAKGKITSQTFVDAEKQPGVVKHKGAVDSRLGSFVKVTTDGNPDNPLRYARVTDGGGSQQEAEMNIAALRNAGATDPDPATGRDLDPDGGVPGKVNVTPIAQNPGGAALSPDEALDNENTQYGGWLAENKGEGYGNVSSQSALDKTMDKYKDDPAFQQYKQQVKDALQAQKRKLDKYEIEGRSKGSGDPVVKGVCSIGVGVEQLQLVTATSPTQSNDQVKEGMRGAYAGEDRQPISTVGHETVNSQCVLNGAGHVGVGGTPTSQPDGK